MADPVLQAFDSLLTQASIPSPSTPTTAGDQVLARFDELLNPTPDNRDQVDTEIGKKKVSAYKALLLENAHRNIADQIPGAEKQLSYAESLPDDATEEVYAPSRYGHAVESDPVRVMTAAQRADPAQFESLMQEVYKLRGKSGPKARELQTRLIALAQKSGTTKQEGPVPSVADGAAALAFARGMGAAFLRGVIYPVSSFMPSTYAKLDAVAGADTSTLKRWLEQPTAGLSLKDKQASVAAMIPGMVGEFAGVAIPGAGIVKGANRLWKVGTEMESLRRVMAAGATAGAGFSAFAKADSGEERAWNIVRDASIGGIVEGALAPIIHSATRAELGPAADEVYHGVARELGTTSEQAESLAAMQRAGITTDPDVARAVVNVLKDTNLEHGPLDLQAKKVLEASSRKQATKVVIDPAYGKGSGVRVNLRMKDGTTQVIRIVKDPTGKDRNLFLNTSLMLKQLVETGQASIEEIHTWNSGAYTRLKNILQDEVPKKASVIPDAPARGTVAHTGRVPPVGANVAVVGEDGTRAKAAVVEVPNWITEAEERDAIFDAAGMNPMENTLEEAQAVLASRERTPAGTASEIRKTKRQGNTRVQAEAPEMLMERVESPQARLERQKAAELRADAGQTEFERKAQEYKDVAAERQPGEQPTAAAGVAAGAGERRPIPEAVNLGHVRVLAGPSAQAKIPIGSVKVKYHGTGREEVVPLTRLVVSLESRRPAFEFTPHSDGTERRFTLDMSTGEYTPEPLDSHLSRDTWWRHDLFENVDPESDYNHLLVKGFVEKDGVVTLSTTPTTLYTKESRYGAHMEFGPYDRAQSSMGLDRPSGFGTGYYGRPIYETQPGARRERETLFNTYAGGPGGKAATGQPFAPEVGEYYGDRFTAGFEPKRVRTERRSQLGEGILYTDPTDVERSRVFTDVENLEDIKGKRLDRINRVIGEPGHVTHVQKTRKIKVRNPLTGKMHLVDRDQVHVSTLQGYELTPAMGDQPEAVTFRNAARKLIREGAPESTPVRARIAHDGHKPGTGPTMTLGELANLDLKITDLRALREEAAAKGYRVDFQGGSRVKLTSLATEESRDFDHPLEAIEALGRIPAKREGPILEDELQRAWNIGRQRSWDPDVDLKAFLPAQFTDAAFQELSLGRRPLMTFYTKADVSGQDMNVNNVQMILESLAKQKPIYKDVKVWGGPVVGDRQMLALYREPHVNIILHQFKKGFGTLGVDVASNLGDKVASRPIPAILDELSRIPDGLDILKGRSVPDAMYYSWLKKNGMKEEFLKGELRHDSQGMYRVFPDEMKATYGQLLPC